MTILPARFSQSSRTGTLCLNAFRVSTLAAGVALFAAATAFAAQPQARITSPIDNQNRVELAGSLPPRALAANDAGRVPSGTQLSAIQLVFSRTPAQQAALDALTAAQQNPAAPQYHQFLTPDQFGAQFGADASDIVATEAWLQQHGFTIQGVSRSRDRIQFAGTEAQVESAFGAQLHYFTSPTGESRIAPATTLTIPAALASSVLTVTNLSSFRPHSHSKLRGPVAAFTSSQTGSVFLTPKDVATIYDVNAAYNAGYTGTGQSIAVMGQSAIVAGDITNFQTALGVTPKAPTQVLVPNTGSSTISSGDEAESDLDLEYSSAMAPGATVYFVYTGNNNNTNGVFSSLQYTVDNNIANIITLSYGDCEADITTAEYNQLNAILQQGAAQGETILASAGDTGSTDCWEDTNLGTATRESLSADFPGVSQYVTSMGGTEISSANENSTYFTQSTGTDVISSALSYIPEQVWNDDAYVVSEGATGTQALASGGGGVSIFTSRPSWQTGVPGIPSGSFRLVPDISLLASAAFPGYLYCSSDSGANGITGSCSHGFRDVNSQGLTVAGGTSFDAPIFAGLVAVINQAKGYTGGQGTLGPMLYTLASNANTYASAFHDITNGGNQCASGTLYCSTAGTGSYFAATGYDEATGLGSIDFNNLLTAWPASTSSSKPGFTLSATNVTLTAGTSAASTVTVTPSNGFTGAVAFTAIAPSTLTNTCYTIPSATVTGVSPITSALTISTNVSSCPSGATPFLKSAAQNVASLSKPASKTMPGNKAIRISLAGIFLAMVPCFNLGKRRRNHKKNSSRTSALWLMCLLCMVSFGLYGCSNNATTPVTSTPVTPTPITSNITSPGTYTITVIGTSTANSVLVSRTTFTLQVN